MLERTELKDVPVVILMIIAGKYLHEEGHKFITPSLLQDALVAEEGYRISFIGCYDALESLLAGGFLAYSGNEEVFNGVSYHEYVLAPLTPTENVV